MNQIRHGLPTWAANKVTQFLTNKTSPIEGAEAQPVSETDAKVYESLILDQGQTLTSGDQGPGDLDGRAGFIQKSVFNTSLTEDVRFQKDGEKLEVAYDFGDGHHAQYLVNDENKAIYVDMVQSGHSHNLAVFVDKRNPAQSVLFAKDS